MRIIKRIVAAVFLVLVVWGLFGGHRLPQLAIAHQAVPMMLKHPLVAVPVFLGLTALIGRFFCEMMCPLGILQSLVNWLVHPRKGVRRICTRLPERKAQRIVRWSVVAVVALLLIAGWGALAYCVEPYSILSRALYPHAFFTGLVVVILVVAAIGDGRLWCNWICPVGTVFHLVSRIAPYGNRVCKGCANCRRCFAQRAEPTQEALPAEEEGVTRRETVKGLALLAAAGTAQYNLPELERNGDVIADRAKSVLPPGALSRMRFQRMCVGCGLCIKACPTGVLVPSTRLATFGQPELDLNGKACHPACDQQCAKACPAGAIVRLGVPRPDIHVGTAVWDSQRCLRTAEGQSCTLCVRKCPYKAIELNGEAVSVRRERCIGCGICENVCAAETPAIVVEGLDVQEVIRPMAEADLIAEMRKLLLEEGKAVAVAREGVIRGFAEGRGVRPLMQLLEDDLLEDALVVDKVIGRAAAAICVEGGVKKVHALLLSEDAADLLNDHGIACEGETVVPQILNRDQSGRCPMELAVSGSDDPAEMLDLLNAKLDEMMKNRP